VKKDLGNHVSKNNTNQDILIQNQEEKKYAFDLDIDTEEGEYSVISTTSSYRTSNYK
ncbi:4065_t:CDS:1, partial [Acaulospora colombiana]